jgi:Carboxypeptidase regulatory-like domain
VPGARVTARNIETNLERDAMTRPDGRFVVAAVPLGVYSVRIDRTGFATVVLERIELALGSSVDIDVILHPAAVVGAITVTGESSVVDTRRTAIASVVSQDQIAQLPINGRNFLSFAPTTPGVIGDRMPRQGAAATSGLSFGGQSARSNNITVDGFDNNDETVGGVRATFSQETVREFQVLTRSYSAAFGKTSSGVVNIVTKSGTNVPAGTVFGYFRDDALNAKEHFEQFDPAGQRINQPKAPYQQTQVGGVIGGPIRRDRTFYFGSFERLDVTANNFVTIDEHIAAILRGAGFPIVTGHVPYPVTSNAAVFKIDHNISLGQALTLRYNYGDGYNGNTETWGGLVAESPSGPSTRIQSGLPAESKCRRRPLELDTHLVHCTRY